jgi:hypothetical protein
MISQSLEELFHAELRDKMNALTDVLASGGATDWESYKYLTGQIAGLAAAERSFLDFIETSQKEN